MIDSGFDIEQLGIVRLAAGPNPDGSKLSGDERIHLIYMVAALYRAQIAEVEKSELLWARKIYTALNTRGMKSYDIAEIFHNDRERNPTAVANAVAIHPSLKTE